MNALASAGANLSLPTEFIHYLHFPGKEHAIAAGKELADEFGYEVTGYAPETPGGPYELNAEIVREPSIDNVRRMRNVMQIAADRHGGGYDGWEAAIEQ